MSLFKTREFWSTQCGHNEEFDQFSIHVCNIDNSSDGSDKIIVGSHSGILRIYGLRPTKLSGDQIDINELGFDENDVLVEMQFPFPILQVQSGILLSASDKRQLLVLFPRKLSVFSVTTSEGLSEYGFSYSITPLYEHDLQRSAFCLTVGPLGQVKGRDFVCVQSLDCCLMFFEQETSSFWLKTVTTNSLLPTSFAYLSINDTFLIQSADWTLQCFRYQMLAISAHQDENNSKNLRKVIPDWSFELGEQALQIETNASLIIILGERNLFVLRSDSTMYYQKKLGDFRPICCHSYFTNKSQTNADSTGSKTTKTTSLTKTSSSSIKHTAGQQDHKQSTLESNLVILLITEMSTLLIYNDRQLKWACQLQMLYCQVLRSSFYFSPNAELVGCLAFLSPNGHLSIAYLGTNPSVDVVNNVKSNLTNRRSAVISSTPSGKQSKKTRALSAEEREELFNNIQTDKEEFDRELGELRKIINAYNSDFNTLIKLNNTNQDGTSQLDADDLNVKIVNFKFDTLNDSFNKSSKLDKQPTNAIDLEFNLESNKELTDLVISLSASSCFNIKPNIHNVIKLDSSVKDSSSSFQFRLFYDSFSKLLSFRSNQVYLVINYFNERNLPRIYTKLIEFPLNLFIRLQNKSGFNQTSRAGSSTNTSQTSSASQRSLKTNQTIDQASLDQFLQEEGTLTNQTRNTISFQFFTKRSSFNLSELLQEICAQTNLNKLIKKSADDSLTVSNNITVQFLNSKLKLVHVEFSYDNNETKANETNENFSGNRCLVDIIGDDFHANSFVFNLLITKLYQLCLSKSIDKILFNRSSIPMKEYFQLIDRHLRLRQQMKLKKDLLEEHCERLRVIEKRILIKLKDRNISNLNNLESLLNVQHKKITSFANELLDLEQEFDDESIRLNCINQLFCAVLKVVGYLNEEEVHLLEGCLNVLPFVQANDLETWQEVTETSLNFLLKNHLKDHVDVSRMSNGQSVQPENCENIFRLLKLTVEKIFLGNLFQSRFTGLSSGKNTILEVDEEIDKS